MYPASPNRGSRRPSAAGELPQADRTRSTSPTCQLARQHIEQHRAVLRGDKLLPAARRWKSSARCRTGGARRAGHRAPHRARCRAAAPGADPPRSGAGLTVARLLEPAAELATARMLDPTTASHSLGRDLGSRPRRRQGGLCRARLAGPRAAVHRAQLCRHLKNGALLLYDVTSTYLEGAAAELARRWLKPRPPWRPPANCYWPDVRRQRLPGRDRGVRGRYRRSADAVVESTS